MRYDGNKKLFKLWIYPVYKSTCGYDQGYDGEEPWGYEGEVEGLTMDLRSVDAPVTFNGGTEEHVIQLAISALKSEGFSGKLRWVNK